MAETAARIAVALWLGVLTSINPCPLATNVAAISFLARRVEKPRQVLVSSLLYTAGRALAYLALALLLVGSLLAAPRASLWLQTWMNRLLGPLLILVGMVLLDLLRFRFPSSAVGDRMQGTVERAGLVGAWVLGFVFALSFCPLSAALYFGSLIPLAIEARSPILLPAAYGVGTSLPVVVFAVAVASGVRTLGGWFDRVRRFDRWARAVTGAALIGIGIWLSITHIWRSGS